jgi:hypothetical protein
MTDLELLECAQSVYDFLIDDTDIKLNRSYDSLTEIPVFKKMNETLLKYDFGSGTPQGQGLNMILFTLTLNGLYKIYEKNDFRKLIRTSPKDFFSSTKSHDFYRIILRDLKLKLCLN